MWIPAALQYILVTSSRDTVYELTCEDSTIGSPQWYLGLVSDERRSGVKLTGTGPLPVPAEMNGNGKENLQG